VRELGLLAVLDHRDRGQPGALDDGRLALVTAVDEKADAQSTGTVQELPRKPDGLLDLGTHPRRG
jgi:hypothetical protein